MMSFFTCYRNDHVYLNEGPIMSIAVKRKLCKIEQLDIYILQCSCLYMGVNFAPVKSI